jgi:hypothetical protein
MKVLDWALFSTTREHCTGSYAAARITLTIFFHHCFTSEKLIDLLYRRFCCFSAKQKPSTFRCRFRPEQLRHTKILERRRVSFKSAFLLLSMKNLLLFLVLVSCLCLVLFEG